jgi:hypothetical protein
VVVVVQLFIVMEHAGHGDLLEYIKLRGAIAEEKCRFMFSQLVQAMLYLHSNMIAHRSVIDTDTDTDRHIHTLLAPKSKERRICFGQDSLTQSFSEFLLRARMLLFRQFSKA